MYKCTNSFKSQEGSRFEAGTKIAANVYYRLKPQERLNFKQDFEDHTDNESGTVLRKYEGGFDAGTKGFSTYTPETDPDQEKKGK